jgi:hypothetical protein
LVSENIIYINVDYIITYLLWSKSSNRET